MPYYHGPRVVTASNTDTCSDANHCQAIVSTVIVDNCRGLCHLSNIPITFDNLGRVTPSTSHSLNNDKFPCYSLQVLQFSWAVYSFQGRHLASTIQSCNLTFHGKLAWDPFELGRFLFQEFMSCRQVFGTANDMLNHIRSSGDTSIIHGYMIHSPRFQTSNTTTKFWQVQAAIISDLRLIRSLSIVVATVHSDHDGCSVKTFSTNLKSKGWIISSMDVHYLDLGDTVAGRCRIITAVHSSCASTVEPLQLKRPPSVPPCPLGKFIWEPFNRKEYAISLARDDTCNLAKQDTCLQALTPSITSDEVAGISVRYHLHCPNADALVTLGSEVISLNGFCPVFNACPNLNIFQHYFGIEFHHEDHSYVRAISSYEFIQCFGFIDQITYQLSHSTYKYALDAAMPAPTSALLLEQVHLHLSYLCDANSEIFSPNQFTPPAATIQAFVNGAIGDCLPSRECWIQAYSDNTKMGAIRDLVLNPSKINSSTLNAVNFNYRAPIWQSQIVIEDGLLIYRKPMRGGSIRSRKQGDTDETSNIVLPCPGS
jgi:hypothetical protein